MGLINYLKENITIILLSLIIFLSPLIVNYSDLPKGFELPKVQFLNISTGVLLLIFVIFNAKNNNRLNYKLGLFCLLIFTLFIFSTLLSPYSMISLYGNSFRDQGVIFYTLIVLGGILSYLTIKKKNQNFLFVGIFFSAVIQALIGIYQFFDLLDRRPELIDDGYWINGTFGQANFFSFQLILGFIVCTYFMYIVRKVTDKKIRLLLHILLTISLIILILATVVSFSIFGWITLVVVALLIILYTFINRKWFIKIFIGLLVLTFIISPFILKSLDYNLRIAIWETSIRILDHDFKTNLIRPLIGYGFDTLGNVFRNAGEFKGIIIDRGHNIFIDIVMQVGLVGLAIFIILTWKVLNMIRTIVHTPDLFFLFILFFSFLFKSFIHEYSAANIYLFVIILGALFGRLRISKETIQGQQ